MSDEGSKEKFLVNVEASCGRSGSLRLKVPLESSSEVGGSGFQQTV